MLFFSDAVRFSQSAFMALASTERFALQSWLTIDQQASISQLT